MATVLEPARVEQELRETQEALEEEKRVLQLLNQTGARLGAELEQQSLVQAVTDAGRELSGAEFGAFFYTACDERGEVFTLYTLSGAPREAFENFSHPRATAVFAPTFRGEGVIRLADVTQDPRYGQMAPHHGMPKGHLPVRSYLAVPVVARSGEVMGGLFFGHSRPGMFDERAERLVVGMAVQAAMAIDNARLYEEAKRAAAERARLLAAEQAARVEVERISLMKDEFLATLSHELRTPLNAMLGWSELLLRRAEPATELSRGLETIARNARAQSQLIDDLLDMNRIVSGKIRLEVQLLDFEAVIEAALQSVRPSAEAKQLQITRMLEPQMSPAYGDANRIQQVVWNLLSNAVKFTPVGGQIAVTLKTNGCSQVELSVADSGIGVSEEFLPHLFERFRQAETSTTRRFGGLGLGLAIVKQLVELHGGTVAARSPGEGRGATFSVFLPLRAESSSKEATPEPPRTTSSKPPRGGDIGLEGVHVLVVDDEQDARELVQAVLESAAAEVTVASGATEALELLKHRRVSVIVSDIGMPERDGYSLLHDVRRMPALSGGETPAIALTAFARSEDRHRALQAGFQAHISKPVEPSELLATVKSIATNRAP